MSLPLDKNHCLVFGISFRDLAITGMASDAAESDAYFTEGAGLRLTKVQAYFDRGRLAHEHSRH